MAGCSQRGQKNWTCFVGHKSVVEIGLGLSHCQTLLDPPRCFVSPCPHVKEQAPEALRIISCPAPLSSPRPGLMFTSAEPVWLMGSCGKVRGALGSHDFHPHSCAQSVPWGRASLSALSFLPLCIDTCRATSILSVWLCRSLVSVTSPSQFLEC